MNRNRVNLRLVLVMTLACAALAGCGDDDSDGGDAGTDADTDADTDTDSDTDTDTDSDTDTDADAGATEVIFIMSLLDAMSSAGIEGATCELLDEEGAPLEPPVVVTSGADGTCPFGLFPDRQWFSAKLTAEGYLDGYVFHRGGRPLDEEGGAWGMRVRMFTADELAEVEGQLGLGGDAGVDADGGVPEGTGTIRGDVWWSMVQPVHSVGSGASVACAEITPLLANTYYNSASDNLPDPALTSTTSQGGWMTFGVPSGTYGFTATVEGASEQSGPVIVYPGSITYPTVTFLEEDYPTNPSSGSCD